MVELPDIPFSYYPMNLDLLYIVPLYFGNDIVPKFIHFLFALMTAGLLFGFLKKRLGTLYALIGSLMFLSTPVIVKLSITVYVDLGLVFFSTAALIYLIKWSEADFSIRYLIFSAAFCGLALGTKYNGLVTFFLSDAFRAVYLSAIPTGTKPPSGKSGRIRRNLCADSPFGFFSVDDQKCLLDRQSHFPLV